MTIDDAATRAKLDELGAALQREAEGAEPDPFDDAVLEAVFGMVELSKTHAAALGEMEVRIGKLARIAGRNGVR